MVALRWCRHGEGRGHASLLTRLLSALPVRVSASAANVTHLVTQADEHTRLFRRTFRDLQHYTETHNLPEDLVNDLRSFMLLKFSARSEHLEVVDKLPPVFRSRIFRILYRPVVVQPYIFRVRWHSDGRSEPALVFALSFPSACFRPLSVS